MIIVFVFLVTWTFWTVIFFLALPTLFNTIQHNVYDYLDDHYILLVKKERKKKKRRH